jgi:hypothetical protein
VTAVIKQRHAEIEVGLGHAGIDEGRPAERRGRATRRDDPGAAGGGRDTRARSSARGTFKVTFERNG